jgi:hypothetical protein
MSASPNPHDVLYGLATVARFAGISIEEAKQLIASSELPTFEIGTMVCGSKAELRAWRAKRERQQ